MAFDDNNITYDDRKYIDDKRNSNVLQRMINHTKLNLFGTERGKKSQFQSALKEYFLGHDHHVKRDEVNKMMDDIMSMNQSDNTHLDKIEESFDGSLSITKNDENHADEFEMISLQNNDKQIEQTLEQNDEEDVLNVIMNSVILE